MPKKNKKARIENIEISNKNRSSEEEQLYNLIEENKKDEILNNKKKKYKILKILLVMILLILILGTAIFCGYFVKSKGNIKQAALEMVTEFVGEQEPIFVLLLGVSDDISTILTDTIMLVGYNPQTQNAFVVSIPRDTYVGKNTVSANGYDKINAKYQPGCEKTISAVEELTGIKIDYYVLIKNNALIDIVDSIGGVKFDVPINMDYDDITQNLHIHLKSGLQILTGEQAEQLVRFRHNNDGTSYPSSYGDNDFGRMRTQREFIKTVAKQLIRLDNVPKVKEIATAIFDNIETNMVLSKAIAYVPFCLELDIENNLTMIQLPGKSDLINELWFYVPNYEEIGDVFDELIDELQLEDNVKQSHYKRINKLNIKINKSNKKNNKVKIEQPISNNTKNQILTDNILNLNIDNKLNYVIEENNNVLNSSINNVVKEEIENIENTKNIENTQNLLKNEIVNNSNIIINSTNKQDIDEKKNENLIKNYKDVENKLEEDIIKSTNVERYIN